MLVRKAPHGQTPAPDGKYCDSAHAGNLSVCWGASCTYKSIDLRTQPDGANPGEVWLCSAWTDTGKKADWGDQDYAGSSGTAPDAKYCDDAHAGNVSICWGPSCTYKTVDVLTKPNGTNPGEVWVCGASFVSARQTRNILRQAA
jgi:hypothetical protein